ncbi:MAG: MtnX-like HAD-IB family phosphatase [Candidatus Omnitrophica bacterium]|nr:MtnX-like HAD-IB family phosphatase [Candidatus Omnitrophota bacterium]MBU1922670.1 MtnX-like HAD-IB family phosphatase [Candidatus Omnitrophota bacterium]
MPNNMLKENSQFNPRKCVVFFDFDNTIATCDVFDNMLLLFSRDDRWVELEKRWKSGRIGSKTCMEGQLRGMDLHKKSLDAYLPKIKLDPYFKTLYKFLQAKKVKTIVLSDNFDYILNRILKINGIKKLKVMVNKLSFTRDKVITEYPFKNKDCQVCAHCKTKNLLAKSPKGFTIIYVGDGTSDICPAKYAHLVFAKENLLRYFKDNKLDHVVFHNLKEVFNHLQRKLA